jgi:signal-transduction protein with cAMP-binding, CBS, and nucleotidyltransferase domain
VEQDIPNTMTSLLSSRVGLLMKPDVVILESDETVDQATKLMKEKNSRSVLVSKRGEVIGIVSKTDILFKVISQNGNPSKVKLREIMTCPVFAVGPGSTIKEALSVMDKHSIRQVMVHAYAAVLGVVTREDIYQSMETLSMTTEDTAISGTPACIINTKAIVYTKDLSKFSIVCPYCQSPFDTKEGLSKHIDRLHGESGILEGDVRRLFE